MSTYFKYGQEEWDPVMQGDLTINNNTYGVKVSNATFTPLTPNPFTQGGVFYNIKDNTVIKPSLRYVIVVLYLRVLFCKNKILEKTVTDKVSYITGFTKNAIELLHLLPAYLNNPDSTDVLVPLSKSGGMDTAKIYNAQGLIQEMSAFNRGDSISPAMNFPSPFSGSIQGNTLGVMDSLPPEAVKALMPPLVGGKKKVKRT